MYSYRMRTRAANFCRVQVQVVELKRTFSAMQYAWIT